MNLTVEQKLKSIYKIQELDSKIDALTALRGELPIEVSDLEDEIAGLQIRVEKVKNEINNFESEIASNKQKIKDSEQYITKFKEQLNNVKNNREYDALNKEIEIMGLEIESADKKIAQNIGNIDLFKDTLSQAQENLEARKKDLDFKKDELKTIIKETEDEEKKIAAQKEKSKGNVEERLLNSYERIRTNMHNGIAVANIERASCGGCFAKIPPQTQSDIKQHLKIIACEHCGRFLVDSAISGLDPAIELVAEKPKRKSRTRKTEA